MGLPGLRTVGDAPERFGHRHFPEEARERSVRTHLSIVDVLQGQRGERRTPEQTPEQHVPVLDTLNRVREAAASFRSAPRSSLGPERSKPGSRPSRERRRHRVGSATSSDNEYHLRNLPGTSLDEVPKLGQDAEVGARDSRQKAAKRSEPEEH